MKIKSILALLFLSLIISLPVPSSAADMGGSASIDLYSNYIWRGIKLSDDKGVVQPSVTISNGSFSAGFWSNYDLNSEESNETDLTLSYAVEREHMTYEVGYIYYALDGADLDDADNDTQELYLSVSCDKIFNHSVALYYDFDAGEGGFLVVSADHSIPLPVGSDLSLDLGASISVNLNNDVMSIDTNGDGKSDGFTDFYNGEVSASVSIPLENGITLTPKLAYTTALSNDAEDAIKGLGVSSTDRVDSIFYAGIGATFSF